MTKHVKNMKEYLGICQKYVGNMKKYVEKCKKYERIRRLGMRRGKRGASHHLYISPYIKALELGIIRSSPHVGSGT